LSRVRYTQSARLPSIKEHPEQLELVKTIDLSISKTGRPCDFINYMETHHANIPPELTGSSTIQDAIPKLIVIVSELGKKVK
jgi:hypothetical protein